MANDPQITVTLRYTQWKAIAAMLDAASDIASSAVMATLLHTLFEEIRKQTGVELERLNDDSR